ncbi:MAG: hypothetical protein KAS78_02865 [Candidatus Pacebacteria bacterium]|nr:hypothetical protein [Candidatus Paceibacterota bacterium]
MKEFGMEIKDKHEQEQLTEFKIGNLVKHKYNPWEGKVIAISERPGNLQEVQVELSGTKTTFTSRQNELELLESE